MSINSQPIEKRVSRSDDILSVHSIFETIQGEGPFCGTPCVFIRLAGCNLQCPACDTDYTSGRENMSVATIILLLNRLRLSGLVVITGGEPFRQDLRELLHALVDDGYYVQIESNGTLPPSKFNYNFFPDERRGVYIVCSPKTGKIDPAFYTYACAFKYVVQAGNVSLTDGLPLQALEHTANPFVARPPENWERPIYVQPMDAKDVLLNAQNMACAVTSSLRFGYTVQLQIHKYLGVE